MPWSSRSLLVLAAALLLWPASALVAGDETADHVVLLDQQVLTGGTDHPSVAGGQPQQQSAPPSASRKYRVKSGDCLWRIAQRLLGDPGLWPSIYRANKDIIDNPNLIYPGQVLTIPGASSLPTAPPEVSGNDTVHGTVTGGASSGSPAPTRSTASAPGGKSNFNAVTPLAHARVSSNYGWRIHPITGQRSMHGGIDLAVGGGTPIRATGAGTVILAGWSGGGGRTVKIKHPDGTVTTYCHCRDLKVTKGQKVTAGSTIATVNSTGMSTGNHLHFEVSRGGKNVDPRKYFHF